MMSTFSVVTQPDWTQHDAPQQRAAKARLQATAPAALARNLEQAAVRFQPPTGLLDAINAAIVTRSPLLLTGEPGTGKTQVAWFLKRYFNIELFEYQVRSDSQSVDLRYDFDAVAYLRDAYQVQQAGRAPAADHAHSGDSRDPNDSPRDPRSQHKYLKQGVLWRAYAHADECIVLLDEIDKAPRDFPNDVLQELDQHRFAHPFHEGTFIECREATPLIVITSNGERRMPDAFLRRCIVFHIELDQDLLQKIMQAWELQFPHLESAEMRTLALERFMQVRDIQNLSKKPGAAELLLWLSVLSAQKVSLQDLQKPLQELPARFCLLKHHADYAYL